MRQSELRVGQRVKTTTVIDIFPIDIFEAGLTGVVTDVDLDNPEIVAHVRLDHHFASLNEWDNELQVWAEGEPASPLDASCFEAID